MKSLLGNCMSNLNYHSNYTQSLLGNQHRRGKRKCSLKTLGYQMKRKRITQHLNKTWVTINDRETALEPISYQQLFLRRLPGEKQMLNEGINLRI